MSTLAATNIKNASSATTNLVLDTSGNVTGGGTIADSTAVIRPLVSGTAVNSTSGTAIDFTSIPSWAKRITVGLNGVSISSTAHIRLQLGTGGTPTTTGYVSNSTNLGTGATTLNSTSGFDIYLGVAAASICGSVYFTNISGNIWTCSGMIAYGGATGTATVGGVVTLSGLLNIVRLTSSSGTDTFDAGSVNILWE